MKINHIFFTALAAVLLVFHGCKGKTAKELIVNKWKFTELSGPEASEFSDSLKKKIYEKSVIEFRKDGSFETSGGFNDEVQKGTYSLSDDGKKLYSKNEGSSLTDTLGILELSNAKMVISSKNPERGMDMTITMAPK